MLKIKKYKCLAIILMTLLFGGYNLHARIISIRDKTKLKVSGFTFCS
jgi:hypothetical protein